MGNMMNKQSGGQTAYVFLGRNGQYRTGHVYLLDVRPGRFFERRKGWNVIVESPHFTPYGSMEAFLTNWDYCIGSKTWEVDVPSWAKTLRIESGGVF